MILRIAFVAAGLFILVLAERLSPRFSEDTLNRTGREKVPYIYGEEDDILDNRTKWKVLVAGYIVFALIAVFSVVSVFTLNSKINTLYHSVQELESTVGSMTQGK